MAKVFAEISTSLDGFVAGPNPSLEEPLGVGGEGLHDWTLPLEAWRRPHGLAGGETGPESDMVDESVAAAGAVVMGRKMFSGGSGPWETDPKPTGWWGDEPPFRKPVFVVTHHAREPLQLGETTFTFVTDGVVAAVEEARTAAGEKDVLVAGGGSVVSQAVAEGLADELHLHVAPILLGGGAPLFEGVPPRSAEIVEVLAGPRATHVRYRL
ncbi:MAG TPA: dihydrofolate reductase family protein [Gaiellaceae bacterium]|nr:dihydrofolate reductase family protein [Gaiellaceae bacterium]